MLREDGHERLHAIKNCKTMNCSLLMVFIVVTGATVNAFTPQQQPIGSRPGEGEDIVDVLRYVWKKEATLKLQGSAGENEFETGHQELKESEESRRMLENRRRLDACSLTKGVDFNVVSASCNVFKVKK